MTRITTTRPPRRSGRVGWHEIAGLAPLMALIVLIGVYPNPIFERQASPVHELAVTFPPVPQRQPMTASSRALTVVATSAQDRAR